MPLPSLKDLGQRLSWLRRRSGLSQRQLGSAAGLSHTAVGLIEKGTTRFLEATTAFRLAWALAIAGESKPFVAKWLVCGDLEPSSVQASHDDRAAG